MNDNINEVYAFAMLDDRLNYTQYGLTKREYFAAIAMQGILSNCPDWTDSEKSLKWVSQTSAKYADALIKELNKQIQ